MTENRDTPQGLTLTITAYVLWGLFPLYMKLLSHIGPVEIVAHRVIWSIPIAAALLLYLGRTKDIRAALSSPRTLAMAALTAALVSVNWGIYVWAVTSGHALDAALGYYINPLFSVLLGALLLSEKLAKLQILALCLAAAAVVVLTVEAGKLPIAALGLTLTWGFYGFFKKTLPIGPNQAFLLETLLLLPAALAYLAWLGGGNHIGTSAYDTWLLLGCGLVTATPLLLFANGVRQLRLTTTAILQYIVPTMVFLIGVFIFNEPFTQGRMIAFPMIWAAVILYILSAVRNMKRPS